WPRRAVATEDDLRWRLSVGDALLKPDRPAEDRRRQVGMAVEELEVARDGFGALHRIRVQLRERRRDGVGETEVLHPARVPCRLQEHGAQEDAPERPHRYAPPRPEHGSVDHRRPRKARVMATTVTAQIAARAGAR